MKNVHPQRKSWLRLCLGPFSGVEGNETIIVRGEWTELHQITAGHGSIISAP